MTEHRPQAKQFWDNLITESDVWCSLIRKTNTGGMTGLLLLGHFHTVPTVADETLEKSKMRNQYLYFSVNNHIYY